MIEGYLQCSLVPWNFCYDEQNFFQQAEPCKSVEQAMKRCVNGMFAEIKYDGERVQVYGYNGH